MVQYGEADKGASSKYKKVFILRNEEYSACKNSYLHLTSYIKSKKGAK
jgi:hypothetical protein